MAWDEWEQLKARAAAGDSAPMRLDHVDAGGGTYGPYVVPARTGDLKVGHDDLVKIGTAAHHLYDQLWDKARVAVPNSDSAAGDLSGQGFAVGAGLQHVADRWEEQLKSLMDACAQISNRMQTTKAVHADDENYILRQMSGIDVLDAGFDERVGAPGKPDSVHGEPKDEKE
ncbi:hypothetical protein [Streptomyces sp. NPDC048106]|uniref:hypothetical protein n=1 Tax=Streptomyces sp. NPDC048106 TaxID=3155750 RepID=UPI003453D3BA